MKHLIDKIQLYNRENNSHRFPNPDGTFFVHYINIHTLYGDRRCPVWDNSEHWPLNNNFIFVPAIIQHFFGEIDEWGNDIYVGDVMVLEVSTSNIILQKTIWENAKYFDKHKNFLDK